MKMDKKKKSWIVAIIVVIASAIIGIIYGLIGLQPGPQPPFSNERDAAGPIVWVIGIGLICVYVYWLISDSKK